MDFYKILHSQQIKKQLTGSQIEDLLNYFLFNALEPLLTTLWFKNQIALLINYSYQNPKFKITSKDKNYIIVDLYNIICSINKKEILYHLKLASLDRSYIQEILFYFLEITDKLLEEDIKYFKNYLEGNFKNSDYLTSSYEYFQELDFSFLINANKKIHFWLDNYLKFKEILASKYYRFAYKNANMIQRRKENIDKECLFKSLLMSINTAIDKYTCEKGTLTSYIQLWFKSTFINPKFNYEMGIPYKLSIYARKKEIDNGTDLNVIPMDSLEFTLLEEDGKIEKESDTEFYLDYNTLDLDLIKFLDSIENSNLDLVKIILNIPTFCK